VPGLSSLYEACLKVQLNMETRMTTGSLRQEKPLRTVSVVPKYVVVPGLRILKPPTATNLRVLGLRHPPLLLERAIPV
jgi:hypothetical protein